MAAPRTAGGARTLAAAYYCSDEIFRRETQAIFHREWLAVAHQSELPEPGSFLVREVEGACLLLVRDQDQHVRAFHNVCRHRGTQLCQPPAGKLGTRITCPYHAWQYGLQGQLLAAPHMNEVEGFAASDYGLGQVPCQVWQGLVLVNFEGQELPESWTQLAPRLEPYHLNRLQVAGEAVYEVQANWKVIFQNFNECYHCPTVHPPLQRLSAFDSACNDFDSGPVLGGPMLLRDGITSLSDSGQHAGRLLGDLHDEQRREVRFYTLFPSLFLSPHPDYVLLHRLERRQVAHTRIVCQFLCTPEQLADPGFQLQGAIRFWDRTNRQDWQVCEWTHRGVGSPGYRPGPYSNLESLLAAFDRHYLERLGGAGP